MVLHHACLSFLIGEAPLGRNLLVAVKVGCNRELPFECLSRSPCFLFWESQKGRSPICVFRIPIARAGSFLGVPTSWHCSVRLWGRGGRHTTKPPTPTAATTVLRRYEFGRCNARICIA